MFNKRFFYNLLPIFGIFISTTFLFRNIFVMPFILDDFSFIRIAQAKNLSDFFSFFSPFKDVFYRPIPTELFYFIINIIGQNIFLGHSIVLVTFFVGIYFLFCSIESVTKNKMFSYLCTFLYASHFTHVFQLFAFNTFQEIALFTFLSISFYLFVKKLYIKSILFFVLSLLSKETAIVYPGFLLLYLLIRDRNQLKAQKKVLAVYGLISCIALSIVLFAVSHVSEIEIYKLRLDIHLIFNNMEWYLLWAWGVPNFVPNYIAGLLKPLPDFWNLFGNESIRTYFYVLFSYTALFAVTTVILFIKNSKDRKYIILLSVASIFCFFLFLLPVLPIIHRWMVRLTLPLIFITIFQGYIMYKASIGTLLLRCLSILLIFFYITLQIIGIPMHESSGLFSLEAHIVRNTQNLFRQHKNEIEKNQIIYFQDTKENFLGGSKKLKVTYHDQDFLFYLLPNTQIVAVYAFESPQIPKNSYIIVADTLIK